MTARTTARLLDAFQRFNVTGGKSATENTSPMINLITDGPFDFFGNISQPKQIICPECVLRIKTL